MVAPVQHGGSGSTEKIILNLETSSHTTKDALPEPHLHFSRDRGSNLNVLVNFLFNKLSLKVVSFVTSDINLIFFIRISL